MEARSLPMDADTLKPARRFVIGQVKALPAGEGKLIPLKAGEGEAGGFSFFQNYTTDDGLAMDGSTLGHNVTLCDKNGNLWFATNGAGVSRYDGKSFVNFTQAHGLPNNFVYGMAEAPNGDIWFVTYGAGICRYDGHRFTNFTTAQGLADNRVISCAIDKRGRVWVGTMGFGLSCYDGHAFTNLLVSDNRRQNVVKSLAFDSKGTLWIGSARGLSSYDGKVITDVARQYGLPDYRVQSIKEDKHGRIWFGTDSGGVLCYNGKTFRAYTMTQGLISKGVFSIAEDKAGHLWFGTDLGLSRYDGKSFTNFTKDQGLSSNLITGITLDKAGYLWLDTYTGGVDRYDGSAFTSFSRIPGFGEHIVTSVGEDRHGNLWFGTYDAGVFRYDGKSFQNYSVEQGLASNMVYSILEDRSGKMWFGTGTNGLSCYDGKTFTNLNFKNGLATNDVRGLVEDKYGVLWIGTFQGLSRYDGKSFNNYSTGQGLVSNNITCLLQDRKENIWVGTIGGGLSRFDGKSFTNYKLRRTNEETDISAMAEDPNGILWFGTSGSGLCRFDGTSFLYFTTEQGLQDNSLTQITVGKENKLLIGTNFGVAVLKGFEKSDSEGKSTGRLGALNALSNRELSQYKPVIEIYNSANGYPLKDVNSGGKCLWEDQRGVFWVANGANKIGLIRFDYAAVLRDSLPPHLVIQGVKLNEKKLCWYSFSSAGADSLTQVQQEMITFGKPLSREEREDLSSEYEGLEFDSVSRFFQVPKGLVLPYRHNHITFDFAVVEPAKPYLVKYQYMLEGYDSEWSPLTSKTSVSFGNMNEGLYTFKIRARNPFGIWCEPMSYQFRVLPPWWRTWWMYVIYIILSVSGLVSILWYNGQLLRKRARELASKVEEATKEIKDQKKHLEEKHKEITDSINYAERIQRSLLASKHLLVGHLKDYFILYKPKAVVSGDFYWAATTSVQANQKLLLCVADSTGHGVPGAIMSILNIACLEKSIEVEHLEAPDEILNHTRRKVIETLRKDGSAQGGRDGMDCCLLSLDVANRKMSCALANVPVWIIRDGQLLEIKRDRYPIGKHERDQEPFTLHQVELEKGDAVYAVTDGYADQFGGPFGKKFKYKHLQALLLSIAHEPMPVQQQKLFEAFEKWRGNLEQVDDVTVFGFRL